MKSNHRLYLALSSVLLAALLLFLFLPKNTGAYRAVPAQTSVLMECAGLLKIKVLTGKTTDSHWRKVLQAPLFQQGFADAEAALKLFKHDPALLRAFAQNKALAAFSIHPADSLHALFVLELDDAPNLENLLKVNTLTSKFFPHQFHGNDIYTVHLSKTERMEVAVSGRLLLFSRRATLVEDALAQLENARNWWADRPYLADLPDAPLRLHLRPSALAEQWRGQMHARWRGLPDMLARNLEWAGLAWDGKTLTCLAENKGFFSQLASWGASGESSVYSVLPDNTAFLARVGLRNAPDFFSGVLGGRSSDFDQFVLPWVGTEAALAVTEPLSPSLVGDRLLLLAVRDSAKALSSLRAFGKARGTLPGITGNYQMFEVFGFPNAGLLQPMLGADDEAFRNPVCALVGGQAVFAPDRSSLEVFLDKYLVNQTLAANTDFLQLQQKNKPSGGASFLLNTAYLPALLSNISDVECNDALARTGFLSAECSPGMGRKTKVSWASQPLSQPLAETDILWKAPLLAPVAMQPYWVEQADGKTFALVQDVKNQLYCLNAQNGEMLWSRVLPEPILSAIQGIDFYGNGTKCYTFGTASQVFTLDENGRDVQGFPFKLPARATNGALVVDFDQNTHFNYFVACENGKIYGFGHLGKPLDGWNGLPAEGVVAQPMRHFQHKGKDYLAALSQTGRLSVFGRDGALRFPPVQLTGSFSTPLAVDAEAASPRIYCGNAEGQVFVCDLQGKWSAQSVGQAGCVASFGQLSGDARYEIAVLERKKLTVKTWEKLLFTTQFPERQQIVFFPKSQRMGTVDARGRRIWLLDPTGKTASGFPLGGNTMFVFGQSNGVEMLMVGNGSGVWAYRVR